MIPKLAVSRWGGAGWGVPETMESARQWSGYVCPDCRFVFRVPRDHDGNGIVCPSCRRLMRIPTTGDAPPPLLAPLRRMAVEDGDARILKKRRRGKKLGGAASHAWEQNSHDSHSGRSEKRQMRLMLVGGVALFSLIVGGVVFSMNRGAEVEVRAAAPVAVPAANPKEGSPMVARSEAFLLAASEPLVRRFLAATTVDDLLPLVRNPTVAEARMRAFYTAGKVEAVGMSQFNSGGGLSIRDMFISLSVVTRDHEERALALIETPQGLKIDWESWVGWSDISWEKFLATKPVTGHVFRVTVSAVEYYNFGFDDESKWRSYRLISPDGENSLYGYVERGSVLEQRIRPDGETKGLAMMLSLKFPEGATTNSQVVIETLVADGWVEEGNFRDSIIAKPLVSPSGRMRCSNTDPLST